VAPTNIERIVEKMRNRSEVTFTELANVCAHYFGQPRMNGSHWIYKTPWPFDPRVNIQPTKGKAKTYQVRQVLDAITKLATTQLAKKK
jgi:hypothetical protein